MSNRTVNVTNTNSGAPFWGIVDNEGNVRSDSGRLMIFKTRKEARNRNKRVVGHVRKVFVSFEVRSGGGA